MTKKITSLLSKPQVLALFLLALTIPVTFYAVSQNQDNRQQAAEVFGNLSLEATFNSIGIEVKNTTASKGTLEFKKTSDSLWRKGLDLWQASGALYGKALLLEPNTTYDIKVTYGSEIAQGSITTRAENIPVASSLNSTHFVRADGNDSNSGTSDSPSGAWKTISKAMSTAPAGAIVQVGPGYYTKSTVTRTTPITLKAQFPAVDDNQNIINAGKHSVIENVRGTRPTGSASTGDNEGLLEGPWKQVQITGPNSGKTYTIWKWENSPLTGITQLGVAATRQEQPERIAHWKMGSWDDPTRAEYIMENNNYRYGFYYGQTNSRDLFIVLPPNAPSQNPNELYVTVGKENLLTFNVPGTPVNGANARVSGFEFRNAGLGVRLEANQTYGVIDHNLFNSLFRSVYFLGDKNASPPKYTKYNTIQYNRIQDSNMRNKPGENDQDLLAWNFIKSGTSNAWNSNGRTGEANETSATYGGGGQSSVFRYNTVEGTFNGFGANISGFDRYTYYNHDYHDNTLKNIPDDSFEFETGSMNNAIWNNRIEYSLVGLSAAPSNYGPMYIFKNTFYRLRVEEVPEDDKGNRTPSGGKIYKMEGMAVQPMFYFVNNTVWSDGLNSRGWTSAGGGAFPGWFMRNNIVVMTQRIFAGGMPNPWDEDYNMFAGRDVNDSKTGHELDKIYRSVGDLAEYRAKFGGAQHTNKINGQDIAFVGAQPIESQLVDAIGGNLSLKQGSAFVDAGTVVPNIADKFVGNAPDIGAFESGFTASITPQPTIPNITVTPTPTVRIEPTATRTPTPTIGVSTPTPTRTVLATPTSIPTATPNSTNVSVLNLTLINADTNLPVPGYEILSNGTTIYKSQLPTNLNIRANVSSSVRSVKFGYNNNLNYRIENSAPYAFAGDTNGNYAKWKPGTGSHTIIATPYAGSNATGTTGSSVSVTFTISDTAGSPSQSTSGLVGMYYNNKDFTSFAATRVDSTVNFNWAKNAPFSTIGEDTFSIRWSGYVVAPTSGTYTFYVNSDDGARLWVNNQKLIDKWTNHRMKEYYGKISLTAGQRYPIKLEYYENEGDAGVELKWAGPNVNKTIIPQTYLRSN